MSWMIAIEVHLSPFLKSAYDIGKMHENMITDFHQSTRFKSGDCHGRPSFLSKVRPPSLSFISSFSPLCGKLNISKIYNSKSVHEHEHE